MQISELADAGEEEYSEVCAGEVHVARKVNRGKRKCCCVSGRVESTNAVFSAPPFPLSFSESRRYTFCVVASSVLPWLSFGCLVFRSSHDRRRVHAARMMTTFLSGEAFVISATEACQLHVQLDLRLSLYIITHFDRSILEAFAKDGCG